MTKQRVYIYRGFERIWHWLQALLVIGLAFTGFAVHFGGFAIGFEQAVIWHGLLSYSSPSRSSGTSPPASGNSTFPAVM